MKKMYAYAIYENGDVVNTNTNRLLKRETTKSGYQRVTLSYKGKTNRWLLHRLVATLYLENPENKPCVNHKDGDKSNNDVSNLEWVTYSENEHHSYDKLGKKVPVNLDRWNGVLSYKDKEDIMLMRSQGITVREIAKIYKISEGHCSAVSRGLK